MKREIAIATFLAVMVAMTGSVSAFSVDFQKADGMKQNQILLKNGSYVVLDLMASNLRPQDVGQEVPLSIMYLADCTAAGCNEADFTPTYMKGVFKVTGRDVLQKETLKVTMNAPRDRQTGQYALQVNIGPLGRPVELAAFSFTFELVGANVSGMKFNDLNNNGIKDAGEPGLAGWTIVLRNSTGAVVATTTTDASGNYRFNNVRGNLIVEEVQQTGWTQTFPASPGTYKVTVDAKDVTGMDFGNYQQPTGRAKVVGSGTLGPKAAPELTFKIFAYTGFLPKGTVEVEDNAGNKIVATEINSVKTNKNVDPKTGEIKGKATFNGAGPYDFVVNVKDGGEPTYAPYVSKDWFKISIPAKTYSKEGKLTSGDLQVIY